MGEQAIESYGLLVRPARSPVAAHLVIVWQNVVKGVWIPFRAALRKKKGPKHSAHRQHCGALAAWHFSATYSRGASQRRWNILLDTGNVALHLLDDVDLGREIERAVRDQVLPRRARSHLT